MLAWLDLLSVCIGMTVGRYPWVFDPIGDMAVYGFDAGIEHYMSVFHRCEQYASLKYGPIT